VEVKSTQNFKDVASKIFSRVHNIGAGGVDQRGEICLFPQTSKSINRYCKKVNKAYLIFGEELALK